MCMEVQGLARSVFWWPCRVFPPDICSRLKDISLWQLCVATTFKILLEEWKQDVFAVVVRGVCRETNTAQSAPAVPPGPTPMNPGSDDQRIEDARIILLDRMIGGKWALQIFGVEPASDREHCAADVLQMRCEVAGPPVVII